MFVRPLGHVVVIKTSFLQLRDIFRIHPDTACNTHDLLQCSCDGIPNSEGDVGQTDADEMQQGNVDDDSESENGFVVASQVKPEQINKMDKAVAMIYSVLRRV
jgi:DNA repair and recombination protein RAD54B